MKQVPSPSAKLRLPSKHHVLIISIMQENQGHVAYLSQIDNGACSPDFPVRPLFLLPIVAPGRVHQPQLSTHPTISTNYLIFYYVQDY